jgi:glycosyltransferase involved in cell wall biosynthesis
MRGPDGQALEVRNVAAPGQVSHAETQSLLRRAGIFVSPSLYEPFGLAVVEAARAGLPLVLSDIGGFRELWDEAALYVPPDDPTALADALNRLARDEGLRRTMGRAATARSLRYTIEAQTRAMRQLYEDLIVPGGAAPDGHDDHKKLRGRA